MQSPTPMTITASIGKVHEPQPTATAAKDDADVPAATRAVIARRIRRAARRHQGLLNHVLQHTEQLVQQPFPVPTLEVGVSDLKSAYVNAWINPAAYPHVERCRVLQLMLEGDILPTIAQYPGFSVKSCATLTDELDGRLELIKERLRVSDLLLDGLRRLSELMFQQLASASGPSGLRVEVPMTLLEACRAVDIDMPTAGTQAEVYSLIAARWRQIEDETVKFHLEALRLQLEVRRLGLYLTTAQHLAKEAADLLLNHLDDDDATSPDDLGPIKSTLLECAENPFLGRWPSPLGQGLGFHGAALKP
jgi:hypothetical protein